MIAVLVQAGAILAFLVASWRWPRDGASVWLRSTWINLVTGGGLFVLKSLFWLLPVAWPRPGWISLSGLTHPVSQLLLLFLVSDLARYWLHRMHHELGFFWQFHRVHHSSVHLNATSGLRMHAVDFVQLALLPWVLFGVILDTRGVSEPVWVALGVIVTVMDAFQHADLAFPLSHPVARAWAMVFNNPHFHAWHHTADPGKCHAHYGQALVIWDRLFGSTLSELEPPRVLGLDPSQALVEEVVGLQRLQPVLSWSQTPGA